MPAASSVDVPMAIAGLAVGGALVVGTLVELAVGRPLFQRQKRPGRRAAILSALCLGVAICIIDLTIATGWSRNDPGVTLATATPAVFILIGLSVFLGIRSRSTAVRR